MSHKPIPVRRNLSMFAYILIAGAVVVASLAVWRVITWDTTPEADPQNAEGAGFAKPPSSQSGLERDPAGSTSTGTPAPDFSLTRFDAGETLTLSNLQGQPVILDFFASWCPSCRAEAPALQGFWQEYQDEGILLLGVALNDSPQGLQDFKDEFFLTYPMGLDETGEIATTYRVSSIPTFVFIDRAGRIAKVVVGMMSAETIASEADALLK